MSRGPRRLVRLFAAVGPEPGASLEVSDYPGRWSARRSVPEFAETLAVLVGNVLERSGWWRRGSGDPVSGGLVLGLSRGPERALREFASEVLSDQVPAPYGFLAALPSSAASVLGLLHGLTEYQATLVGDGAVGARAFGHALDQIALGRLDRVILAATGEQRSGLALTAERSENPGPVAARSGVAFAIESLRGGTAPDASKPRGPDRSRAGGWDLLIEPLPGDPGGDRGEDEPTDLALPDLVTWLAARQERGETFEEVEPPSRVVGGYRLRPVRESGP